MRLFGLAFVNANGVAVGVENDGHVADWGLGWLDSEFGASFFEFGDGGIKILDFQCDATAIGRRFPFGWKVRDGER